jgi:acyl-CoA thioesterase FadM
MYPFIRLPWQFFRHRNDALLGLTQTHVSQHICWPWDLDVWMELNNGRTLTLYDLGRLPMSQRIGLLPALRRNGWGMAVAGASIRYRRRVRMFDRIEIRSRPVCWDDRFFYAEQSMWLTSGDCASHALLRSAATDARGIVAPARVIDAMGHAGAVSPPMPDWVAAWVEAEAQRSWPPMQDNPVVSGHAATRVKR